MLGSTSLCIGYEGHSRAKASWPIPVDGNAVNTNVTLAAAAIVAY